MSYNYSSLGLNEKFSHYLFNGAEPLILTNLSGINIFIGANNSGKSMFMREIAKLDTPSFQHNKLDLAELSNTYSVFRDSINTEWTQFSYSLPNAHIEGFGGIQSENTDFKDYIPSAYSKDYFSSEKTLEKLKKLLIALRDNPIKAMSSRGNVDHAILSLKHVLSTDIANEFINLLDKYIFDPVEFKKYYIPTLRSLNDFDKFQVNPNDDMFSMRIKQVYGFTDDQVDVFSGQILYERIRDMLLGDLELRNRMREYERFLSSNLFEDKEVVIVPKQGDDVIHVRIGNTERPIYELGDGIQNLIILTFPLFECENGMFFIEEPETNMHPGMQRKFMEALQIKNKHQYFITTHSNHLLDLTLDYDNVSIFTFFSKLGDSEGKHRVELVTYGDRNVLELIGAKNTSMFLVNKTIWVEGITDRLYIKKYLDLYIQKESLVKLREDVDFTFVEYGGDNIVHWSFLDGKDPTINVERLCGQLMLVMDSDGNKKQLRKSELKSKLGKRYYLLQCREIENSLSLRSLERVIGSYEEGFIMPNGISNRIRRNKPIGSFIEENIFRTHNLKMTRQGGYKESSGTVKQKLAFCNRAIKGMSYGDMSNDARNLAEAIYNFISEN